MTRKRCTAIFVRRSADRTRLHEPAACLLASAIEGGCGEDPAARLKSASAISTRKQASKKIWSFTVPGKLSDDLALGTLNSIPKQADLKMSDFQMRFAIVIEDAGGNYLAYVPDLTGCVAAGATLEKTEQAIREAIEFHLDGLRADNLPIPKASSRVDYVEVAA